MKKIAPVLFVVFLVSAGSVVGWEAKNWHLVIGEWYEKAAAYDFVGDPIMQKIMIEVARERVLEERRSKQPTVEVVPAEDVAEPSSALPAYPALKPGQIAI